MYTADLGKSMEKSAVSPKHILANIPIFSSLEKNELEIIEFHLRRRKFGKNQIVLFEEDNNSYMYIVYSGKVRVVKMNDQGREQILSIHKKNDFFGEMALMDGKTAPATVIAMEDSEIGLLSKSDFDQYLLTNDKIRQNIVTMLCSRLREAWLMIKIMSFATAEQRVLAVLDNLKDVYGVKDQRGTIINLKLTHSQIANYASVSRETASRAISKLTKNGTIEVVDRKFLLKNK
jgi:CRP/FNR family transcriptional regulator